MANGKRKCRYCKPAKYDRPENMVIINGAAFCTIEEASKYAREQIPKQRKKIHKREKREFYERNIKTRREAAVRACNKFILLRDRDKSCISCDTPFTRKPRYYHAGHYIAAGTCSALRFDERNIFKQCSRCNAQLSGNRVAYRERLIKEYGQELVDYLEGPQPTINITADWYKSIEDKYKAKCKEIEEQEAA